MLRASSLIILLIGITIVGGLSSSDTTDLEAIGNKLADNLPDVQDLPINASHIPTQEEAEELMKEKCLKNGGEGAFERAQNARDEMQACAQSLVNVTELQAEMDVAKPTGDLDTVFRKYCKKSPVLSDCIRNFTSALEPCMEEKEKKSKDIVQNIIDAMLGFICFKEGDRIALFIAEGGPECLQSKEQEIKSCLNSTVGKLVPTEMNSLSSLPMLVLEDKECNSIHDLQRCVVTSLEKCSEPTPANIVESLFKFVIKMTPCEKILTGSQKSDGDAEDRKSEGGAGSIGATLVTTTFLVIGTRLLV
ncbi:27 kDa hemolymph protein [Anabrus simplex]|uniref:27 kDa hemolymph protein n=1 Tax=Anabrus simplex TaxID=316456 RepID=UPI0034DD7584